MPLPSTLRSTFRPFRQALAVAALATLGHAVSAADVAPYYGQWDGPMLEARQAAGMTSAVLAFAVTRGNCALDAGFVDKLPDARGYVAAGNRLYVSWGGTAGVYAEEACTDDGLFGLMDRVVQETGSRRFDFDIEGTHVQDADAHARRARVLARMQQAYPDLQVTVSLPGWLNGFSPAAIDLLRATLATGVRIDSVVVMSQSFGQENLRTMVSPSTVSQATIDTFRAASAQVAGLFPGKTPAQLNAMLGITTMNGRNDDGSLFTLDDARVVAEFVKANGIGFLSYWSFGRDRAGQSDVAQPDYEFHRIFKTIAGDPPPAPPAQ